MSFLNTFEVQFPNTPAQVKGFLKFIIIGQKLSQQFKVYYYLLLSTTSISISHTKQINKKNIKPAKTTNDKEGNYKL